MILFLDDPVEVSSQTRLLAGSCSPWIFRSHWPSLLIFTVGVIILVRYFCDQNFSCLRSHIKVLYSIEHSNCYVLSGSNLCVKSLLHVYAMLFFLLLQSLVVRFYSRFDLVDFSAAVYAADSA